MTAVLFLALAIWVGTEMWIVSTRDAGPSATLRDRGSRFWVVGGVGLGVLFAATARQQFPLSDIAQHHILVFCLGIGCMAAGIALRIYAVKTLGRFFTTVVATHVGQTVVDNGPYRFVRHPSYSGALLTFFGLCLGLANWMAFIALVPVVVGLGYRIAVEEQALVAGLGEPYREYMRRTKRLIPFVI